MGSSPRSKAVPVSTVAIIALLAGSAQPAAADQSPTVAYVDSGQDPREGVALDIRSSRRLLLHTDKGRRLVVRVRLYDFAPFNEFEFRVALDSRGDHKPDFVVVANNAGGPFRCRVRRYRARGLIGPCEVRVDDPLGIQVITLRVTARDVRPDKHIRWRVLGAPWAGADRAPDRGWYG